jgi:hypothetical protein
MMKPELAETPSLVHCDRVAMRVRLEGRVEDRVAGEGCSADMESPYAVETRDLAEVGAGELVGEQLMVALHRDALAVYQRARRRAKTTGSPDR